MKFIKRTYIYRSGVAGMDIKMQDLFWLREVVEKGERSGVPSYLMLARLKKVEDEVTDSLGKDFYSVLDMAGGELSEIKGKLSFRVGAKTIVLERYSRIVEGPDDSAEQGSVKLDPEDEERSRDEDA